MDNRRTFFNLLYRYGFLLCLGVVSSPAESKPAVNSDLPVYNAEIKSLRDDNPDEIIIQVMDQQAAQIASKKPSVLRVRLADPYFINCYLTLPGKNEKQFRDFWRRNSRYGLAYPIVTLYLQNYEDRRQATYRVKALVCPQMHLKGLNDPVQQVGDVKLQDILQCSYNSKRFSRGPKT